VFHLAQINVATLLAPTDSPVVAEFMEALAPINALADGSPGFVWRLEAESGNATDIVLTDDPLLIVNMSVWESLEALRAYVYKTAHVEYLRRRREWFEKAIEMHLALWWVPVGEEPSAQEGLRRIAVIREHGPTQEAFTLAKPFAAPGVEIAGISD
jgi:heme-degrading monooxygenase HmoA